MGESKPPDPLPCPNLQLVLAVCREVELVTSHESTVDEGLGSVKSASEVGQSSVDLFVSERGRSTGCLTGDARKTETSSFSGWKSALVGTTMFSSVIENPKVTHGEDGPMIALPDSVMDNVTSGLKLCVVGRFVAFRPSIEAVRKWVINRWKVKGNICVSAMPSGLFCFRFTAEEDLQMVLSGIWYFGKHCLALTRWHPGFDASLELNKLAPVWVRLPGLPLEFWDEVILRWVGNSFGHFVTTDKVTMQKSRLDYARFCVNVALNRTLPSIVTLKTKWGERVQPIEYENAGLFCQRCG